MTMAHPLPAAAAPATRDLHPAPAAPGNPWRTVAGPMRAIRRRIPSALLGSLFAATLLVTGGTASALAAVPAANVIAVRAGNQHACMLTSAGGVRCWGLNNFGQVGANSDHGNELAPVDAAGFTEPVREIAVGRFHSCALTKSGGVKCWGYNDDGELGDGTTHHRSMAVDVTGLTSGVAAIAAGGYHTCALTAAGGVKCWGYNDEGQLGDGTTTGRLTAVNVSGLASGVTAIAAGDNHTCALTTGGGVKCWGFNVNGELGDGSLINRPTPVDVAGLASGVASLAVGVADHMCAVTTGGAAKCWGNNQNGAVGDGTRLNRKSPVDVAGLGSGVTAIAVGWDHTCALTGAGGVKCWGVNGDGVLGDGTTTARLTPVDVNALATGVSAIATGYRHACALLHDGTLSCWGDNGNGQLADGTTTDHPVPAGVPSTIVVSGAYQGMWWNSPAGSESGWGVNFNHQDDTIFATWFTFGLDGKPLWLVAAANRTAPGVYAGTLYTGTGPPFNAVPFDPQKVVPREVGTATITFIDGNQATFAYVVDGVAQSKTVVREVFGAPVPTCAWGAASNLAPVANVQGLWWAAPAESESGWGINFTHQGDTIFATWFTFGLDGNPLWLVVGLSKTAPGTYAGNLYTGTGPPFSAVPFDPSKVVAVQAGTATVTFADGDNATFAYTLFGVAQTKPITRQVFAVPGTACQ